MKASVYPVHLTRNPSDSGIHFITMMSKIHPNYEHPTVDFTLLRWGRELSIIMCIDGGLYIHVGFQCHVPDSAYKQALSLIAIINPVLVESVINI